MLDQRPDDTINLERASIASDRIPSDALRFLELLTGASGSEFTFVAINSDRPRQTRGNLRDCANWIEDANNGGASIFVVAQPTDGIAHKAADIKAFRAVYADFDTGLPVAFPLDPSIVVESSPGRFHVYWLMGIGNTADAADFASVISGIKAMWPRLPAGACATPADPSFGNATQSVRLPGTVNRKPGANGHVARIVTAPGHRYSVAELLAAFPAPPAPPASTRPTLPVAPNEGKTAHDLVRGSAYLAATTTDMPYDDRFKILAGMKGAFGDQAKEVCRSWLSNRPTFNDHEFEAKWRSIQRADGANFGSVRFVCKAHGTPVDEIDRAHPSGTATKVRSDSKASGLHFFVGTGARPATHAPDDDDRPLPLVRPETTAADLTGEAMGPLEDVAYAIQRLTMAPLGLCLIAAISSANVSGQAQVDVEHPSAEYPRPISLMFTVAASSGERKSEVGRLAFSGIERWASELACDHEALALEADAEMAAYSVERKRIDGNKKLSHADRKKAILALGPKPTPPRSPKILMDDMTSEGLAKEMLHGQFSSALVTDEGALFVGGHAMNEEARLRSVAFFSKLNDGAIITKTRAGEGGSFILRGRRHCWFMSLQPGVLRKLLGDEAVQDQGFLNRMHVIYPQSTQGSRMITHPSLMTPEQLAQRRADRATVAAHADRLYAAMAMPQPLNEAGNGLEPRVIRFSNEASLLWHDRFNEIEGMLPAGGELAELRGYASKIMEHIARIAATFAFYADPNCIEISTDHAVSAIALGHYLVNERLRLNGISPANPQLVEAEKVREWLSKKWKKPHITRREMVTNGPPSIRDKRKASAIIDALVEHRWLVNAPEIDGRKVRNAFSIVRVAS